MGKLDNKLALITGGSSGIGLTTAQLFAAEGADVIITGRDPDKLEQAKSTLPLSARAIVSDTGIAENIKSLIDEIRSGGRVLDILVPNAGYVQSGSLLDITSDQFDRTIDVNVKGVFFTIQEAVRQKIFAPSATIVTVTGIINMGGHPNFSLYALSKAGLAAMVRCLALELIGQGIRFNAVCAGAIETPIFRNMGLSEQDMVGLRSAIEATTPIGRFGRPEELARAILFLASDDSSFMVGAELVADGGKHLAF